MSLAAAMSERWIRRRLSGQITSSASGVTTNRVGRMYSQIQA